MSDKTLISRLASLSPEQREALLKQLKQKKSQRGSPQAASITPCSRDETLYPLSYAQQRLWFIDQFQGQSANYNISAALRLEGPLDVEALRLSFEEIIQRHEVLRTVFLTQEGQGLQQIITIDRWELPTISLEPLGVDEQEEVVQARFKGDIHSSFDLASGPLLRARLFRLNSSRHVLILTVHHIIFDGWSMGIFIREMTQLYDAFRQDKPSPLSPLPIQYIDYGAWQRNWLVGERLDRQIAYWKTKLDGCATLDLPTDFPRPAVLTQQGSRQTVHLDSTVYERVKSLARSRNVTPFMLLFAALQTLLYRYTAQHDICVGTPIAGRTRPELEALLGCFVNTLAIRSDLSGNPTFTQLLSQVQQNLAGAYDHQDIPFERLVDELNLSRDLSHTPLFQTFLVLQNAASINELSLPDLQIELLPEPSEIAKFDLTIVARETDGLAMEWEYRTDLFRVETILQMARHFCNLLVSVVDNPEQRIDEIEILSAEEKNKLLVEWNNTTVEFERDSNIVHVFREQARRTPTVVAIKTLNEQLTYRELDEQSDSLASSLINMGLDGQNRVGLISERSINATVAILGILKCGCAYVPLDPAYPEDRLQYMIADAGCLTLLGQRSLFDRLKLPTDCRLLDVEELLQVQPAEPRIEMPIEGGTPAYVMYTSGSTGKPKGIEITHKNILRFTRNSNFLRYDSNTVFLQYAPISFDASNIEIWGTLLNGGQLVVAPAGNQAPEDLGRYMRDTGVNSLWLTAALFHYFAEFHLEEFRGLSQLVTGGDVVSPKLAKKVRNTYPNLYLANGYGPTENTSFTTVYPITDPGEILHTIPIGRPIANTKVFILDKALRPVPIGVIGELYTSGEGVATGYINRPELTASVFIENPYATPHHEVLYKTGDMVRFRHDGNIEYVGRIDYQVKIRGYRIEIGEIENALELLSGVRHAKVIVREENPQAKKIVAYYVAEGGCRIEPAVLRSDLKKLLPEYMIPMFFVAMDELPITANGKLDTRALPRPELDIETNGYLAEPRNEKEQALLSIWKQVLGLKEIGIRDNFFEAGGDSILSIQIVSRAKKEGIHLTTKQIFENQTIEELAKVASDIDSEFIAEQGLVLGQTKLTPIQCWFFEQGFENPNHWNQSVLLEFDQDYRLDDKGVCSSLNSIVDHHDALRARFSCEAGKVQSWYSAPQDTNLFHYSSINVAQSGYEDQLTAFCNSIQKALDISEGPTIGVGRCYQEGGVSWLVIVVHHLVVDGISWRVLLEDFIHLLDAINTNEPIQLPIKTTALHQWAAMLEEQVNSGEFDEEIEYWQHCVSHNKYQLPYDFPQGDFRAIAKPGRCRQSLDRLATERLLREVHSAYRTDINDLLLTALVKCLADWSGQPGLYLELESHGRESAGNSTDLSRTVGWFTSLFPVWLSYESGIPISENLKSIKEQLRRIPHKGLGYGCIRYLKSKERSFFAQTDNADIAFNYLGQFDSVLSNEGNVRLSSLDRGLEHGPENHEAHVLSINGYIVNGVLTVEWLFNEALFSRDTVTRLSNRYMDSLSQIIEHCRLPNSFGYTPSDFPLAELSQSQLDRLIGQDHNVESIYPLSPMQQGMLFHSLFDTKEGVYFEQLSVELNSKADKTILANAWSYVVNRHPALRSAFLWQDTDRPIQVVYKKIELDVSYLNWQFLSPSQEDDFLNTWLKQDRDKGFDFSKPGLMRLALIELPKNRIRLVWSFHHIVLDGWSLPLVMNEVFCVYGSLLKNKSIDLPVAGDYKDFIAYLQKTDISDALQFWKLYLDGFETATPLPNKRSGNIQLEKNYKDKSAYLDIAFTRRLQDFARENRVTFNTLLQAAWGVLLARYSGEQDIVFGTTVSGRPADLSNVENIVGLFINTLPLRIKLDDITSIIPLIRTMQEQQLELRRFEYTPLADIQRHSSLVGDRNLFETILVFENYPIRDAVQNADQPLDFGPIKTIEHTNFPLTVIVEPAEQLHIRISYDNSLFDSESIDRILQHLKNLLHGMLAQTDLPLLRLPMLSEQERKLLLHEWNPKPANYPRNLSISQIFERHVNSKGGNIALILGDSSYTYSQLNARANQLAHLLNVKGVKAGDYVALILNRSVEMIVGMLATLKVGAAYVPVDPDYPVERINHILTDSGVVLIVTVSEFGDRIVSFNSTSSRFSGIVEVDRCKLLKEQPVTNIELVDKLGPNRPVYVMYTSGSTGTPKGVLINQLSVIRLVLDANYITIQSSDKVCHLSNVSFDAATFEVWGPLLNGASIVLFSQEHVLSPQLMLAERDKTQANIAFLTTALFNMYLNVLPDIISRFKILMVGGETLDPVKVRKALKYHSPDVLMNVYGPTENTTFSTAYVIDALPEEADVVPVGRSISGSSAYVLDKFLQPVPIGVSGELYVGGDGVAEGYLNDAQKTEDSFIPNPYAEIKNDKIYKTGDIARYNQQGQLEILGRTDDQVKVRGFRIQLSEIEANLARIDGVIDAVATTAEVTTAQKQLVAYVVVEDKIKDLSDLRAKSERLLPKQMIPSFFVIVDHFPLTKNGKVDKRLLPKPQVETVKTCEYLAPRNEKEGILVKVWEDVLKSDTVGVKDNFFDLGGDSILSIQIISRAKQHGLQISAKQIFDNQTISDLAEVARELYEISQAEQGDVSGLVPLSSIQYWFFEKLNGELNHFNQSILLELDNKVTVEQLEACWHELVRQHDVLRASFFVSSNGSWHQDIRDTRSFIEQFSPLIDEVDLSGLPENLYSEQIEHLSNQAQSSISLNTGPLFKLIHFNLGEETPARFLIIVHHLIIDVFSWRVLMEDMQAALSMLSRGSKIDLGSKTSSVRQWSELLDEQIASGRFEFDIHHWQAVNQANTKRLPYDQDGKNKFIDSAVVEAKLEVKATSNLLTKSNRAYRTEINDLLLAALAKTLCCWTGDEVVRVDLEGHGREDLSDSTDLSRTIGWFTSIYPILLTSTANMSIAELVKVTKESLRSIPHKGLSYGVLKYLAGHQVLTDNDDFSAEISFNYLGQLDQSFQDGNQLSLAREFPGQEVSADMIRPYAIDISAKVLDSRLEVSCRYSKNQFHQNTMEQLINTYMDQLRSIIEHCSDSENKGYTPSDFPLACLTQQEIDQRIPRTDIETLLPLSPVQEGMLFHALYEPQSWVYFDQVIIDFNKSVDENVLFAAWNEVVQRHQILRTSFLWEGLKKPLQLVAKSAEIEIIKLDLAAYSESEANRRLEQIKIEDRDRGFDFTRPGIMRLTLCERNGAAQRLIWSFHHIILDGWSMPIVFRELFYCYEKLINNQEIDLPTAPRYDQFIGWLQTRSRKNQRAFWREYLSGFVAPNALPIKLDDVLIKRLEKSKGHTNRYQEAELTLSKSLHTRLISIAKQNRCTVNQLIQGVWAVLISKYTGDLDVVFGATVSGRPAELAGIESMVGLFINTLPMRFTIDAAKPFMDWLSQSQKDLDELKNYEHSSLVDIQSCSELDSKQSMFDTIVVFENYPIDSSLDQSKTNLEVGNVDVFQQTNFPLTLICIPEHSLVLRISYDSYSFESDSIQRLLVHLEYLINCIQLRPQVTIQELTLVAEQEADQLSHFSNEAHVEENRLTETLIDRFKHSVKLHPNRVAAKFNHSLVSYDALELRSDRLAQAMKAHGVRSGERVALRFDRSSLMLISMLATVKLGAAYVPIDPETPPDRQLYMIKDSSATLLLSAELDPTGFDQETLPEHCRFALYESLIETIPIPDVTPINDSSPDQLVYIIYTSGTTGEPKGVCVGHQAIIRLVDKPNYVSLDAGVRVGHASNVSFDAATFEVWGPLLNQGTIVGIDKVTALDAERLSSIINDERIQVLFLTTALFNALSKVKPSVFANLEYCLFGGEMCDPRQVRKVLQEGNKPRHLMHVYGPTENTTFSTWYEVTERDSGCTTLPIGAPISNSSVYVLDECQRQVPIGVYGEICVGGLGLASGYLNKPDITKEKFIKCPWGQNKNIYRTGDLGRLNNQGLIEIIGRFDDQVKIRGYRIELGEVESAVRQLPGIKNATVVSRKTSDGINQLVAYCELVDDQAHLERDVRIESKTKLKVILPNYMVPSIWVIIDKVPVTKNGKVDKNALPEPIDADFVRDKYVEPRNPIELQLTRVWCDLLGIEKIGIYDDFFDLGGHSLLINRLSARIKTDLNVELPLRTLFELPTIASVAEVIKVIMGDVRNDPGEVSDDEFEEGAI